MSQATDYLEEKVLGALKTLGSVDLATGAVTAGGGGYIGLMTSAHQILVQEQKYLTVALHTVVYK